MSCTLVFATKFAAGLAIVNAGGVESFTKVRASIPVTLEAFVCDTVTFLTPSPLENTTAAE